MRRMITITALACLLLGACTAADHDDASASVAPAAAATAHASKAVALDHFDSSKYGFRIDYPPAMHASRTFDASYLNNDAWKTYARADSQGTPVLALTLPGSNKVTAGELRIGVSDAATEVKQCSEPPDASRAGSVGNANVNVNGIDFAHFDAGDAAMSHYLAVHSYRTVHAGRCYAIDLLVIGTNPEVYDPPATPPFTHDEAFARLYKALQGFRFMARAPSR